MTSRYPFLAVLALALPGFASDSTFILARELLSEQDYPLAAVEFRRHAMETDDPLAEASSYLYAGYSYLLDGQAKASGEMFDRAESADAASQYMDEIALLNGENAYRSRDPETALYYYDLLASDPSLEEPRTFALRRAAAIHLAMGDIEKARDCLEQQSSDPSALDAVDAYAGEKKKRPVVGGLLGLVPGAGYWYSGEVANGFRSLILNSLFIYGMADTAQDDEWGAFAIITFFELTWYSGSVYGGIDAAQRYNRDRLEATINDIEGGMEYRPDPSINVPLFKLDFEF